MQSPSQEDVTSLVRGFSFASRKRGVEVGEEVENVSMADTTSETLLAAARVGGDKPTAASLLDFEDVMDSSKTRVGQLKTYKEKVPSLSVTETISQQEAIFDPILSGAYQTNNNEFPEGENRYKLFVAPDTSRVCVQLCRAYIG